jgi:hypothetical protein
LPCHLPHAVCEWVSPFQRIAAGPRMRIGYVAGGLKQAANPLIRSSSLSACVTCECERLAEVDPIPLLTPQFSHGICICTWLLVLLAFALTSSHSRIHSLLPFGRASGHLAGWAERSSCSQHCTNPRRAKLLARSLSALSTTPPRPQASQTSSSRT